MNDFNSKRTGSGTMEWAEVTENICRGCANDCLYCYAAATANRFKLRDRDKWYVEEFTKRANIRSYPARDGVIMFPSSHDITPFNVDQYIRVARLILEKGNNLLIVSKPRRECIEKICIELEDFKEHILFRFTIGSLSIIISSFWEPGAPDPDERTDCLAFARNYGYKTSVSIEPMLEGVRGTKRVVDKVLDIVTENIWIGKMNKPSLRVSKEHSQSVKVILRMQRDSEIMKLYEHYKDDPIIRWKDSINLMIDRSRHREGGGYGNNKNP